MATGDLQVFIDHTGLVIQQGSHKVWCSTEAGKEFLTLVFHLVLRAQDEGSSIAFVADQWEKVVEN